MVEKNKTPIEPFDGFTVVIPGHNTMQCNTWVPKLQVTIGGGVGVVLKQGQNPIAFERKKVASS